MKILIFGLPGSGKTTLAKSFAELIGAVHLNADEIRTKYNDWDFTKQGRVRQAQRMRHLADGVVMAGKTAIADFVCPTYITRLEFSPDFTVWMDTVDGCEYNDTNILFEPPEKVDYHVSEWFSNTHEALEPVIKRWMERNGV